MYVDKSENEFSIHQLDQIDIELIFEALIMYGNEITKSKIENKKALKKKVSNIINQIEHEYPNS